MEFNQAEIMEEMSVYPIQIIRSQNLEVCYNRK